MRQPMSHRSARNTTGCTRCCRWHRLHSATRTLLRQQRRQELGSTLPSSEGQHRGWTHVSTKPAQSTQRIGDRIIFTRIVRCCRLKKDRSWLHHPAEGLMDGATHQCALERESVRWTVVHYPTDQVKRSATEHVFHFGSGRICSLTKMTSRMSRHCTSATRRENAVHWYQLNMWSEM